ncbi:hypothetical protein [Streptomyces sp. NPDC006285]|uniref:hypothetical protein n=1 Tax=Streptomyces sp. NPDC006285 TaxID=3364742 RepID=UPI003689BC4E
MSERDPANLPGPASCLGPVLDDLPGGAGEMVVQGEDLGAWIGAQRAGWDKLMPTQQYLLETLGSEPPAEDEVVVVVVVRRSQDER